MRVVGRRTGVTAGALAAVALWAAVAPAQTVSDAALTVRALTTPGLASPTGLAFVARGDMLVLQKNDGRVRRILHGVMQPGDVLDVAVNAASERGLLGIAVRPGVSPIEVYVYFTEAGVDGGAPLGNRVYRYFWNGAALVSPQLVLDLPVSPGPNHDGGVIAFTPDDQLLVVIGDLNRDGQLQNYPGGPLPDDSGVVLRVEPDGTGVAGNPFAPYCSLTTTQACGGDGDCPGGESCLEEVARYYAYGVRNSFGLAVDPVTSEVWDTENGPGSYDEVNLVSAGFNSGWERIMGPDARDPQSPSDLWDVPGAGSTYADPAFSWLATVAPTAILFPWGSTWGPAHDAVALVGDANNGRLYRFPLNPSRDAFSLGGDLSDGVLDPGDDASAILFGEGFGVVTDLEVGPDGDVYVLSLSAGRVYRIGGPARRPAFFRAESPAVRPPDREAGAADAGGRFR